MKYSWEFKLECVNKYKNGELIFIHEDSKKRRNFINLVRIWCTTYDLFGADGLKHSSTNRVWTAEERFELVAKVLAGNSISSVATGANINYGQLYQWLRRYQEKGINGLECKPGRSSKNTTMSKNKRKTKLSVSEKEELRLLRERNRYLEMENEYLKKLDALVSKREAAEAKAKRQK